MIDKLPTKKPRKNSFLRLVLNDSKTLTAESTNNQLPPIPAQSRHNDTIDNSRMERFNQNEGSSHNYSPISNPQESEPVVSQENKVEFVINNPDTADTNNKTLVDIDINDGQNEGAGTAKEPNIVAENAEIDNNDEEVDAPDHELAISELTGNIENISESESAGSNELRSHDVKGRGIPRELSALDIDLQMMRDARTKRNAIYESQRDGVEMRPLQISLESSDESELESAGEEEKRYTDLLFEVSIGSLLDGYLIPPAPGEDRTNEPEEVTRGRREKIEERLSGRDRSRNRYCFPKLESANISFPRYDAAKVIHAMRLKVNSLVIIGNHDISILADPKKFEKPHIFNDYSMNLGTEPVSNLIINIARQSSIVSQVALEHSMQSLFRIVNLDEFYFNRYPTLAGTRAKKYIRKDSMAHWHIIDAREANVYYPVKGFSCITDITSDGFANIDVPQFQRYSGDYDQRSKNIILHPSTGYSLCPYCPNLTFYTFSFKTSDDFYTHLALNHGIYYRYFAPEPLNIGVYYFNLHMELKVEKTDGKMNENYENENEEKNNNENGSEDEKDDDVKIFPPRSMPKNCNDSTTESNDHCLYNVPDGDNFTFDDFTVTKEKTQQGFKRVKSKIREFSDRIFNERPGARRADIISGSISELSPEIISKAQETGVLKVTIKVLNYGYVCPACCTVVDSGFEFKRCNIEKLKFFDPVPSSWFFGAYLEHFLQHRDQ